ncbi:hypothetical protein FOZ60_017034 [Perkinsus olseni]|uniref:Uncharacterized protein n=1 Tax=Perkinsus olseni TaxID=32597 RepID=A0A7J6P4I1_PEROL|nr:hypothetical protein FOZ60_017034 [Perkinsus olseni]
MVFVHLLWTATAVSFLVGAAVIKVDISRELEGLSYALVAKLKVDGQDVSATILYKCYECTPEPCVKGRTYELSFTEGSEVTLFDHTGKFAFDVGEVSIDSGLIADYKSESPKSEPHAGLCLRSSGNSHGGYKTLVEQLVSKKVIDTDAFSLYLTTAEHAPGKLVCRTSKRSGFNPHRRQFKYCPKTQGDQGSNLLEGTAKEYHRNRIGPL